MFEQRTSYLRDASWWWLVDPRMARIGEQECLGGHCCAVNKELRTGAGKGSLL